MLGRSLLAVNLRGGVLAIEIKVKKCHFCGSGLKRRLGVFTWNNAWKQNHDVLILCHHIRCKVTYGAYILARNILAVNRRGVAF